MELCRKYKSKITKCFIDYIYLELFTMFFFAALNAHILLIF